MFNKSFEEMGIPPGYGFKDLLFSRAAGVLIVRVCSAHNNWRPERLYFRHTSSDKYQQIGEPANLQSQEFPIVHPLKPILAYITMQHRFDVLSHGEERHGPEWKSLNLFDVKLGVEVDTFDRDSLILPPGIARGWISGLVEFGDSGLFVTAGLSSESSWIVDYVIAEVDLAQRTLKPMVPLPAVFM